MLKEVFASKLVAACVCPIAAGTVALKVPPVRSAIHKATAPKPERDARAKPRVRTPIKKAPERDDEDEAPVERAMMCPTPVMLGDSPLEPAAFQPPVMPIPQMDMPAERPNYVSNCGPSRFVLSMRSGTAVPEPETWAQMVAGFALIGATIRAGRRRRVRTARA
jgi:hypothetical protein